MVSGVDFFERDAWDDLFLDFFVVLVIASALFLLALIEVAVFLIDLSNLKLDLSWRRTNLNKRLGFYDATFFDFLLR